MLKKILILSLFFHLAGFTPVSASQEPASNGWGFGTFLAAGAALIGGFKLALWGAPKIMPFIENPRLLVDSQWRRIHFEVEAAFQKNRNANQIAAQMADDPSPEEIESWHQNHLHFRKMTNFQENPVHIFYDDGKKRLHVNETNQDQRIWLGKQYKNHYKWERIGYSTQQLKEAANQKIPLHTKTISQINKLVLRSYFVDSKVNEIGKRIYGTPSYVERGSHNNSRNCLLRVPLYAPPLLNYDLQESPEIEQHLPGALVDICDEYSQGQLSQVPVLVNKRELMIALGALSCRSEMETVRFKNIHETSFSWRDNGDLQACEDHEKRRQRYSCIFNKEKKIPQWQVDDEKILWDLYKAAHILRAHDGYQ